MLMSTQIINKGETLDWFVHAGVDLSLVLLSFISRSERCLFPSSDPAPCRLHVVMFVLRFCCALRCLPP